MLQNITAAKKLSFLIDGKPFEEFLTSKSVQKNGNVTVTEYRFDGGLILKNVFTEYPEHNACDWVNEWENTGSEPTGIISELWDSDIKLPFKESEPKTSGKAYLPKSENVVKVYAPRGSNWSANEFFNDVDHYEGNRYVNWFGVGRKQRYVTTGGRSSNAHIAPFFGIRHGKDDFGVIIAVGWTGQWCAEIERFEDSVVFKSKIEDTNFRILPGEKFRTSSVTVMPYEGKPIDGQNLWRRFVKEVYSPIGKREVPEYAPFCAGIWGGMSTKGCLERINKVEAAKLPFDHYWMDAGWYGDGIDESPDEYEGDWAQHTGNWSINTVRHPDLLQDVVSAIKTSGKRFLLWFEPERVRRNAPIVSEHPEYLLFLDDKDVNTLLDLGNPDAWNYCYDTLCRMIKELNISVYRQDFNFHPLQYWRNNDTEERKGITEIKHINGMYKLWDSLLEKFPYLLIDNCASGGRRIDVETLRRSVPLWRSDAQCPADPIPEMAQAHAISHGQWYPYSGTGTGRIWFDTYRFRSAYAPALTTNFTFSEKNAFGDDPEGMAWLDRMCKEYIRVRPYLSEDVYPLTEPSGSQKVWSAIQYHDPKKNEGIIQIFRRAESPYESATFTLGAIENGKAYVFEDADGGEFTLEGNDLVENGFNLSIKEKRTSKLYFYKAK